MQCLYDHTTLCDILFMSYRVSPKLLCWHASAHADTLPAVLNALFGSVTTYQLQHDMIVCMKCLQMPTGVFLGNVCNSHLNPTVRARSTGTQEYCLVLCALKLPVADC